MTYDDGIIAMPRPISRVRFVFKNKKMIDIFAVPEFKDPSKHRRAKILVVTQFASVVMILAIVIITAIFVPEHNEVFFQAAAGAGMMIFSYVLLQKGKIEASGWTIVIMGWLILTLDLAFIAGIRGVNVLGQILIVMFAGLAISGKSAIYVTIMSLVTNLGVLYLEQTGLLANPAPLPANLARYFIQTIYTSLAAIYIWRVDTLIQDSLLKTQTAADRYRALFDWTNDGVVILDLEWNWLSSNSRAPAMLGYTEGEFSQKKISDWFLDLDSESEGGKIQELISGKYVPTYESSVLNQAGESLPVEINMALVPDAQGKPLHIQLIFREITDRKLYEEYLIHQAQHDPLTNLPNRLMLEERFLEGQGESDEDRLVAVLYIDIDDFKLVNDSYGHEAGDQVLIEIGRRLLGSVRDTDTVARVGGDEFIIILENILQQNNINIIAEKVISRISDPFVIGENEIKISASIGINWTDKSNLEMTDLIKTSDSAMYQVKGDGKNNFKFFENDITI